MAVTRALPNCRCYPCIMVRMGEMEMKFMQGQHIVYTVDNLGATRDPDFGEKGIDVNSGDLGLYVRDLSRDVAPGWHMTTPVKAGPDNETYLCPVFFPGMFRAATAEEIESGKQS